MPKLSPTGQALMGVGDGTLSVDRRILLARAGATSWLTATTSIANARSPMTGQWRVVRVDLHNGAEAQPMEDPPDGANEIAAGGDRWLAWRPGRGLYGSLLDQPAAGLVGVGIDGRGAAGPDGTLAYCRDRNRGTGFVLNARDGTELEVWHAAVRDLQVLGPTSAIWWDFAGDWRAIGRPAPRLALPAGRLRLATVDGEDWLVYWSEGTGLIAQVDGADEGYVLEVRPIAFNHDAVAANGLLIVAWSTTPGEGPNDLVWQIIDRTAPRTRLVAPPAPIPPVPAIGRPIWVGWFAFGGSGDAPGNAELLVDGAMTVRRRSDGAPLYRYVSSQPEGDIDALEAAIAQAGDALPRVAYWTRGPQAGRVPRGAEVIGIEAYQGLDETLKAFEDRLRRALARVPRAALIAQAYSSNASQTASLAALVPLYAALARDWPNIEAILVFSAGARPTGWTDHPEIHAPWRQLVAGIKTPEIPTPEPGPTPEPLPTPEPEPPMPDLTPDELNTVTRAIGVVAKKAFNLPRSIEEAAQGVRQAIDQGVRDPSWLALLSLAREHGATPEEVEAAAAAGRLLQQRR